MSLTPPPEGRRSYSGRSDLLTYSPTLTSYLDTPRSYSANSLLSHGLDYVTGSPQRSSSTHYSGDIVPRSYVSVNSMSRYTPRSYDTGGSRRYESSLRNYDTGSSYKSYDSGRRYDTGRTYDSGRSYDSGRAYGGSSTSSSSTSSRFTNPTSSSRSYSSSSTTSSYSPTLSRSYGSSYSSRNGNAETTSSRLGRTTSSTKTSDGTSSPTSESRYSRNGYSSPRSSIPSRLEQTNGRSPRSSLSSEPSLELREDSQTRDYESRRSHRRRSDSDDSKDSKSKDESRPYSKYRAYRDTRTDSDKDVSQDETKSRYTHSYDRKTETESDIGNEESAYTRYSRRHRKIDSDASDITKKHDSDSIDDVLRRAERRRLRNAKKDQEETEKSEDPKDATKEDYTNTKEDALTEWRRKRALQQSALSSDHSDDKPSATERFSRRDWKTDSVKESTDDSDGFVSKYSGRRRHNTSEDKDTDSSAKEDSISHTRSSFRRYQRDVSEEKLVGKESEKEKSRDPKEKESDVLSLGTTTRAERIAKYKEERRKELAAISNLTKQMDSDSEVSGLSAKPSLFITASSQRQSSEERSEDGKAGTSSDTGGQAHRRRLPEIPGSKHGITGSLGDLDLKSKSEVSSDSGISENEARFRKFTSLDKLTSTTTVRRASSLKGDKSSSTEVSKPTSVRSKDEARTKSRSRERMEADKSRSGKSSHHETQLSGDEGSCLGIKDRVKSDRNLTSISKSVRRSQSDVSRTSHKDSHLDSPGSESPRAASGLDQLKMKQIAKRGDLFEKKTFGTKEPSSVKKSELDSNTLSPLRTPTKVVKGEKVPLSPDPLDDLLKQNAAFLSDGEVESEFGSSSSTASRTLQTDSKTRKSLRRRHLQKSLSKKSSGEEEIRPKTKGLSKEAETEETSASREQTTNSTDNIGGENYFEVTVTLGAAESSGGLDSEDTQMKKSTFLRHQAELESNSCDNGRLEKRRRFITRNAEAVKDSDSMVGSTESESVFETAPSAPSSSEPVRRKVRKDKSALRKSSLNKTDDENSSKLGSVDSSSDRGDEKVSFIQSAHLRLRSGHNDLDTTHNPPLSSKSHASSTSNIQARARALVERVAQANKPLASTGPSSITISRVAHDGFKKTSSEDSSTQPVRPFSRTKDISSLIQKFSSSDASSSEKSDTETNISRRRILPIRRQDPVVISSSASDESNTESSRRTPERSQSLRMHGTSEKNDNKVQRAGSFKSDFMRKRYNSGDSDKPSPELADVLNKRSNIVEKQEEEDRLRNAGKTESKYERAETTKASEVDEVIADTEVAAVLKARRKQTDSAGSDDHTKDSESKSNQLYNISLDSKRNLQTLDASLALLNRATEDLDSPATTSSDSEILAPVPKLSSRKRSSQESISEAEQVIKNVETSITARITSTVSDTSSKKGDMYKEENASRLTASDKTSKYPAKNISDSAEDTSNVFVISLPASKRDSEGDDFLMPLDEKYVTDRRKKKPSQDSPMKSYNGQTNGGVTETAEFSATIDISAKKSYDSGTIKSINVESVSETYSCSPASSLRRAESLKDSSIKRTESFERRKGILKRTPSLPKQPSRPIVDPELAERLRQQREKENDLSDEDANKPASISAFEDIQEVARREKKEEDGSDSDSGVKLSVLERISQMENKLEEEKMGSSRPRSGFVTPKSAQKAWLEKSQLESSFDNTSSRKHVSGEQLMEKLSILVEKKDNLDLGESKSVSERRQQFQRRSRDDWRTRTQPVTVEEIYAADNLETVSSFRAEVRKNTMISAFNQLRELDKKLSPLGKKCEYPQHVAIDKKRRSRSQRHKTTPVTAAELGAIPEGESMEGDTLRSKVYGQRDSTTDSGILSGSDADSLLGRNSSESLRSLTLEMDLNEDDPARLSVSAKTSIFKSMEQRTKTERDKNRPTASGAKRYIDRKKRERSLTQPVTEDEVKSAAEISDPAEVKPQIQNIPRPQVVNRAKSVEPEDSCVAEEDELVGLSLAEKVKLFTQKKEEKPPPRQDAPVPRRRARKNISRYNTQPVTIEEVEKAASMNRVSPLAASLIKPPDPELLKGLPIAAQREIMAQHAEACLSQPNSRPSSRPSSRPGSRRGSSHDLEEEETKESLQGVRSILKQEASRESPEPEVKSILKTEKEKRDQSEPRGILKHELSETKVKQGDETRGILKHSEASDETETKTDISSDTSEPGRGILKAADSKPDSEPKGILKGELLEGLESRASEVKGVLKKGEKFAHEPRGILKKEGSFEIRKNEPEKSVLKSLDSKEEQGQNLRGILKKEASRENVGSEEMSENSDAKFYLADGSDEDTPGTEPVEGTTSSKRRNRQGDRYLTQPADFTPDKSPQSRRKFKYEGRHLTQPITPEEMKEAEAASTPTTIKLGGSIGDRLNALKKSGDEEWRRRVPKNLDFDTPVKLRDKTNLANMDRPSSIADRLSQLDESKTGWRERVEEKDQDKFTVKGRLVGRGGTKESPLVSRLKHTPKQHGITADPSSNGPSPLSSPTSPSKEFVVVTKKIAIPKDIISGPAPVKTESEKQSEEEEKEPVKVSVPQMDTEAIDSFFISKDIAEITEKIEVDIDDFNEIFMKANEMLPSVKRARPVRSRSLRGRNHLKTRSLHLELRDEYLEVNRGVAEKEFKRMKKETLARDAGFAQEALAGLASKENFAKVALKKAEASTPGGTQNFQPFKDLMLLHVKGRYKIQTRLVEPSATSINSGDCYILVTQDKIINWVGDYCNVIEKARSADIAMFIQQKKDLGCKIGTVATVEESKGHLGPGKHFWGAIGGQKEYQGCGPDEEDELYESHIIRTNMVYRLVDNSLIPYEEYWGIQPKYEMLKKDEVLVFDFGGEMYVWQGKTVAMERRRLGLKLAKKLWERGYDYEDCDINPLCPLEGEDSKVESKNSERPPWALFGKVNQNMETILFREKFADWPDSSRLIKVKDTTSPTQKTEVVELQPYDAKLMIPLNKSPVTLLLEGSHVGRGTKWFEDMEGFIREVDILTLGVSVWHVMEYDHYKMPDSSYGQFHEGDTYVVRWQYMIANAGMKTLKGHAARHSLTGRERCAYFFWQGKGSTINEQGASALMTVELDEERGPQIRVVEGKELPCFLNLFEGRMMVHIGKREDASTNTQGSWRFYCVRGEFSNELSLVEIPLCTDNLRSRSSFILLSVKTGLTYIWHGAKSPQHTRELAVKAVDNLKEKCPLEVGMDNRASFLVTEMEEGSERADFWGPLGGRPRGSYVSLLNDKKSFSYTVRLFYMCSVSGVFKVSEVLYEARTPDLISPFPFLQADLYNEFITQPALFLVDNDHEVYLWQGWWPVGDEEQENVATGSARARFDTDRRCAMHTVIQYCKEKNSTNPPTAYLVCAGVEPKSFTNLFPYWEVDTAVQDIAISDGKEEGYCDLVSDVLTRLSKTQYSLDELLERPLPEGVDPSKLEWYLDDDTFQDMFEMTKDEFYKLPSWKQRQIKQPTGLF